MRRSQIVFEPLVHYGQICVMTMVTAVIVVAIWREFPARVGLPAVPDVSPSPARLAYMSLTAAVLILVPAIIWVRWRLLFVVTRWVNASVGLWFYILLFMGQVFCSIVVFGYVLPSVFFIALGVLAFLGSFVHTLYRAEQFPALVRLVCRWIHAHPMMLELTCEEEAKKEFDQLQKELFTVTMVAGLGSIIVGLIFLWWQSPPESVKLIIPAVTSLLLCTFLVKETVQAERKTAEILGQCTEDSSEQDSESEGP